MKVLVVGGAGFVGSHLVDRLLVEGHSVDVVDDLSTGTLANLAEARADRSNDAGSRRFTFHRLDAADPVLGELLARRRPEVVFHLALPADPGAEAAATAQASFGRMLAAADGAGVAKVVAVLDAHHRYAPVVADDLPLAESHPTRSGPTWIHDGGGSLAAGVVSALTAARAQRELEFTALALASVFGPRQPARRPIHVGTTARSTDDLLYVDDAVDALVRAASRAGGLVVNVGTGVATTRTAASRLAADAGLGLSWAKPADGQPRTESHFVLDPGRAAMQLGWRSWTTVAEGISATAQSVASP